ncbi:MAG: energy transducer TonB, partial [Bacteroidia bacterium]
MASFSHEKGKNKKPKRYAISYHFYAKGPATKFKKTTTALNQHRLEMHIRKNVTFPQQARDDKYCGRVHVNFKIDSKGQISSVEIVNTADVHPAIT